MRRHTIVTALTVLAALLVPGMALAHADLASSNPGDGAIVTTRLDQIELVFTQQIEAGFSIIKIYPLLVDTSHDDAGETAGQDHGESEEGHDQEGGHGAEHGAEEGSLHALLDATAEALVARVLDLEDDHDARVEITLDPASGRSEQVTLTPQAPLEVGAYVVMWRLLSADGHVIEGFLTFDYRPEHGH